MSVGYTGGCLECGLYITTDFGGCVWDEKNGEVILICRSCYDKEYSPQAIRRKKIKKLLKRGVFELLKDKIKLLCLKKVIE